MKVTLTDYAGPPLVFIIEAEGVFDATATEDFMEPTRAAVEGGASDFIIDLSGVSFMSSIGIGLINKLYYDLHPSQSKEMDKEIAQSVREGTYQAPHLKILCPTKNVHKVLMMAGIDRYIKIFNNKDEALASFKA